MPLFGRRRASGPSGDTARAHGLSADPPGWDGQPRGEPGIHGIARARRWDAVVSASAPELDGESLDFVALEGGEIVVEGETADAAVRPLATAVEPLLDTPFRAEARRQEGSIWAVGASSIVVLEEAGIEGRDVELVVTREGRALHVDGRPSFAPAPAFDQAGPREGCEYVVRATRLIRDLWEVEATAL